MCGSLDLLRAFGSYEFNMIKSSYNGICNGEVTNLTDLSRHLRRSNPEKY